MNRRSFLKGLAVLTGIPAVLAGAERPKPKKDVAHEHLTFSTDFDSGNTVVEIWGWDDKGNVSLIDTFQQPIPRDCSSVVHCLTRDARYIQLRFKDES